MTEVRCPMPSSCGSFATTWGLFAHLLTAHALTSSEAALQAARSLEREIHRAGRKLEGRAAP